jgi:hypothetical protein
LRHYDGLGKELGLPELSHLADELLEKGYTYDFISDTTTKTQRCWWENSVGKCKL